MQDEKQSHAGGMAKGSDRTDIYGQIHHIRADDKAATFDSTRLGKANKKTINLTQNVRNNQ